MYRMYADFSDEAHAELVSGDAMTKNGFRKSSGTYHPDQPEFSEIEEESTNEGNPPSNNRANAVTGFILGVLAAAFVPKIVEIGRNKIVPKVRNLYSKIASKKNTKNTPTEITDTETENITSKIIKMRSLNDDATKDDATKDDISDSA